VTALASATDPSRVRGTLAAMRTPRRWFAAPFVVTVTAAPLACAPSSGARRDFPAGVEGAWYVTRDGTACSADPPMSCPKGASCNPPPPTVVECPATMEQSTVRLVKLAGGSCAVLPDGCERVACAVGPTPCPLPHDQRLPTLSWAVNPIDGKCLASPGRRNRYEQDRPDVEVPCLPLEARGGFIDRAAPGAECHACALSPCDPATSPRVDCPPEPP